MLRHPWLQSLLNRLHSRRLGWDHLALCVAVGAGVLLIGVGLVVLTVTLRDSRVRQPDPNGGVSVSEQAAATQGTAGPSDRVLTGANADEVARRLAVAPTERWAYALRSADRRPPPALHSGNDPLATSNPHPAPPVTRRVVPAVPASALGFAWPLSGVISSPFGDEHPLGIDIAPTDALGLVLAAREGVVLYAGGDPCCSYGYYVILDHGDGLTSIYGHFRELPYVEAGERIERGTVLGVAGDTGHSFGEHLHFEVRLNGIPVDPQQVLTGGQLTPLPVRIPPRPSPSPEPSPSPPSLATEPAPSPFEPPQPENPARESAPAETPAEPTAVATTEDPTPTPETPTPEPPAPEPPTPEATATVQSTATATRTPTLTSTPTPAPSTVTPTPTATATMPATPTATPSPAPTPTPTPTPTPSPCETVRLPAPGQQSPSGFITLEATPDSVTSLIAQRCATNEPAVVIAKPLPERNCMAVLADRTETQSKRLIPVPQPTPTPGPAPVQSVPELRWVIPPADLTPGAVLRVSCVEPASSLDP